MIDLEARTICSLLQPGERVLDIGCANGYSTVQFAAQRGVSVLGVDYIPEMIAAANQRREQLTDDVKSRLQFRVGDITQLDVPVGGFDKTIVIRVIINLGDWNTQLKGLKEAARTVRVGGQLLLSEATVQGWESLNRFRAEWGLDPIPQPPFNCYLDESQVVDALADECRLIAIRDFASTYYVGTRVIKPLIARCLGVEQLIPNPNMDWNRWFSHLPAAGNFGTQKLFVFERR